MKEYVIYDEVQLRYSTERIFASEMYHGVDISIDMDMMPYGDLELTIGIETRRYMGVKRMVGRRRDQAARISLHGAGNNAIFPIMSGFHTSTCVPLSYAFAVACRVSSTLLAKVIMSALELEWSRQVVVEELQMAYEMLCQDKDAADDAERLQVAKMYVLADEVESWTQQ